MQTNKDLLKQAIAEAKTIREAAIANAKEALEESLTPHLREMLAQKLQEMDELDETDNNGTDSQVDSEPTDIDHGNIVKETKDEEADEPEEDENEPTEEEGEEEDLNIEDMSVEDLKNLIRDIVAQETGHDEEGEMDQMDQPTHDDMTGTGDDEEIDINEILAEIEMEDESMHDEMEEGLGGLDKPRQTPGKGTNSYSDKPGAKRHDLEGVKGDGYTKAAPAGINPGNEKQFVKFVQEENEELEEALDTVAKLRTQLQEVNLLNAKLLYVNKVFKANNLTEGQKVNVVAAFDKAETVKEVKLVFETVSKNITNRPATIVKEHKSFASKPVGSTKKQVINEVSEAVNRMQILAGIKPRQY